MRWPDTDVPIFNEDYTATIVAHPSGSNNTVSWNVDFTVNSPNLRRYDDSGNGGGNGGSRLAGSGRLHRPDRPRQPGHVH
ncbi:MAG: hypothetical protein R2851_00685 [Caldilineaceae bacterium]